MVKEFLLYQFLNLGPENTLFFPDKFILSTLLSLRLRLSTWQLVLDKGEF